MDSGVQSPLTGTRVERLALDDLLSHRGRTYYETDTGRYYVCDSAAWYELSTGLVPTDRITGNTTLDDAHCVVLCDTDGGAFEVDLPAGVDGTHYKIINCGSSGNDVTVDPNGTEQIWGQGAGVAVLLTDGDILDVHFETTENWW